MLNELSKLNWFEITILLTFLFVALIFISAGLCSVLFPARGINRVVHDGEPNPYCSECHGIGVLNIGDEHFESDCPCKMRFY